MSIATVAPSVASSRLSHYAHVAPSVPASQLSRTRRGLTVVDGRTMPYDSKIATVSSLDDAPSRRLRLERLRAEDPTVRRQPHYPRGASESATVASAAKLLATAYQAIRAGLAQLRMRQVGWAFVYIALLVGVAYAGLSMQGEGYVGQTVVHSVRSGESVWSLAAAVDTDRPLEDVVLDIQRLNNVSGALNRGQQIVLPLR